MIDIVDALEFMANNYAYATRRLTLLGAILEIQSLRMKNKSLDRRAYEAERRVRWLEGLMTGDSGGSYLTDYNGGQDCCLFCGYWNQPEGHTKCRVYSEDGTLNPTPEDFK